MQETCRAESGYGFDTTLHAPFGETVARTTEVRKAEGFGVLTTIDVRQTMQEKFGSDFEPYVILGACNLQLAHRGLQAEHELGLLMPCNVIVHEHRGKSAVSVVDPAQMLGVVGENAKLGALPMRPGLDCAAWSQRSPWPTAMLPRARNGANDVVIERSASMMQKSHRIATGGSALDIQGMSRRRLIGRLAAAGFSAPVIASILRESAFAQEATPTPQEVLAELGKSPELIQRGSTTFETPMVLVADDFLTPNDMFFIRSNGPISIDIPVEEWRLAVTGLVGEELELTFDDLQGMPSRTITAFLECSGNSRDRFGDDPQQVEGTQWGNGAIGNAEWTGVSLAEVLNMAGVREGAVDVVAQGGDFPEMQRGLPLNVAMTPDVMLVWEMNGEPLPAPNGGPVRLLVPTWSGIASTKWVVGIDVIDRPFAGPFNSESYVFIDEDERVIAPVREVAPKSIIASPAPDASLDAGAQQISGFAWSGYASIDTVEVSTDDGANWAEAEIVEEAGPLSWVRFVFGWDAQPGDAVLASRATDLRGLTQPETDDWNAKGYLMNAVHRVPVRVD